MTWVSRLNPVYDAYFAPLKDKHHYWFGVLLLVRGVLLVIFTSTYTVNPSINHLFLLMTTALLLCYANNRKVYKNKAAQHIENFFLLILVLIGGSGILQEQAKHIVVHASICLGFLAFCGFIVWNVYVQFSHKIWKGKREFASLTEMQVQQEISSNARFRESILDEPLLN